jgi:hypothetical protein
MSQFVNKPKPWNTPFGMMLGITVFTCIMNLIAFKFIGRLTTITGNILFGLILWPSLVVVETFIYWLMRRRVRERRWVWTHLLFSLFAFVLVKILYLLVPYTLTFDGMDRGYNKLKLINQIQLYCFWSCIIIGHVFFIIAIVQSLSKNNAPLPGESDDFLSELPG